MGQKYPKYPKYPKIYLPKLLAQIACPSPKVWYFDEKRLHRASVVRGPGKNRARNSKHCRELLSSARMNEGSLKQHHFICILWVHSKPSIRDGVLRSGMLLYLHHKRFRIFFHPAKFDNFKDEKISDFKTVSVSQRKNLLD